MVLSSQNARLCRNCVLIRPTINDYEKRVIILGQAIVKYNGLSDTAGDLIGRTYFMTVLLRIIQA